MNHNQDVKFSNIVPPAVIKDNASFTSVEVDTKGFNYLTVVCALGATDIAMAALKLQSGDVSGTLTDVTGLNFSGGVDMGSKQFTIHITVT